MKALAAAKADRDYPIVSAASICAKVTRDTELRDWKFEPGLTGDAAPSRKFGCGYPGGALPFCIACSLVSTTTNSRDAMQTRTPRRG